MDLWYKQEDFELKALSFNCLISRTSYFINTVDLYYFTSLKMFSKMNIYFPLPPLKIYEEPLPFVHSFKMLGVFIDTKLSWHYHIKHIQNKLSRACGVLYTIRKKIPRHIARTIYLTIAYPYLIYGNTVWSSCYKSKLQKLLSTQKHLIRIIMKRERTASSDPLFKN